VHDREGGTAAAPVAVGGRTAGKRGCAAFHRLFGTAIHQGIRTIQAVHGRESGTAAVTAVVTVIPV
jgi:hypothetical protein